MKNMTEDLTRDFHHFAGQVADAVDRENWAEAEDLLETARTLAAALADQLDRIQSVTTTR